MANTGGMGHWHSVQSIPITCFKQWLPLLYTENGLGCRAQQEADTRSGAEPWLIHCGMVRVCRMWQQTEEKSGASQSSYTGRCLGFAVHSRRQSDVGMESNQVIRRFTEAGFTGTRVNASVTWRSSGNPPWLVHTPVHIVGIATPTHTPPRQRRGCFGNVPGCDGPWCAQKQVNPGGIREHPGLGTMTHFWLHPML